MRRLIMMMALAMGLMGAASASASLGVAADVGCTFTGASYTTSFPSWRLDAWRAICAGQAGGGVVVLSPSEIVASGDGAVCPTGTEFGDITVYHPNGSVLAQGSVKIEFVLGVGLVSGEFYSPAWGAPSGSISGVIEMSSPLTDCFATLSADGSVAFDG